MSTKLEVPPSSSSIPSTASQLSYQASSVPSPEYQRDGPSVLRAGGEHSGGGAVFSDAVRPAAPAVSGVYSLLQCQQMIFDYFVVILAMKSMIMYVLSKAFSRW